MKKGTDQSCWPLRRVSTNGMPPTRHRHKLRMGRKGSHGQTRSWSLLTSQHNVTVWYVYTCLHTTGADKPTSLLAMQKDSVNTQWSGVGPATVSCRLYLMSLQKTLFCANQKVFIAHVTHVSWLAASNTRVQHLKYLCSTHECIKRSHPVTDLHHLGLQAYLWRCGYSAVTQWCP